MLNVVYGLSVSLPGRAGESGINADNGNIGFESPQRNQDATYSDMVRVADVHSTSLDLGCPGVLAALDTLATIQTIGTDAAAMRKGNIDVGSAMRKVAAPIIAGDALGTAMGLVDILNADAQILEADAKIFALLVKGGPLMADLIWKQELSKVNTRLGMVFSMIQIPIETFGTILDGLYMDAYLKTSKKTEDETSVWSGGVGILSAADHTRPTAVKTSGAPL